MAGGQKDSKEGQVLSTATVDRKKTKQEGSVYTSHELAADAQAVFGVMPDIVTAALREKGITKCTKPEACKIIQDFVKREVK